MYENFDLNGDMNITNDELAHFRDEIEEMEDLSARDQWLAMRSYGNEDGELEYFKVTSGLLSMGKNPLEGFDKEDFGDFLSLLGIEADNLDEMWSSIDSNLNGALDANESGNMWQELLSAIDAQLDSNDD